MEIRELELWQKLDDEQAEKISGGEIEGCLAWSIGFADVVRPTQSQAPNTVTFETKYSSTKSVLTIDEKNPLISIVSIVPS